MPRSGPKLVVGAQAQTLASLATKLNPMGSGESLAQLVRLGTFWLGVTGSSPVIVFFVFEVNDNVNSFSLQVFREV